MPRCSGSGCQRRRGIGRGSNNGSSRVCANATPTASSGWSRHIQEWWDRVEGRRAGGGWESPRTFHAPVARPEAMKISVVTPAKAGVHCWFGIRWIPAFPGMTCFSREMQATRTSGTAPRGVVRSSIGQSFTPGTSPKGNINLTGAHSMAVRHRECRCLERHRPIPPTIQRRCRPPTPSPRQLPPAPGRLLEPTRPEIPPAPVHEADAGRQSRPEVRCLS